MKTQRLLVGLTVLNLVILVFAVAQIRPVGAQGTASVLRGRSLEIVDAQGRLRASVGVLPPSTVGGKAYPETVIFRLIDAKGRPEVKITGSVEGGSLGFVGADDATSVILEADGSITQLKLANKDGRQQIVKP